jgi:hypothetical protein
MTGMMRARNTAASPRVTRILQRFGRRFAGDIRINTHEQAGCPGCANVGTLAS